MPVPSFLHISIFHHHTHTHTQNTNKILKIWLNANWKKPDHLMASVRQSCRSQSDYVSLQWKWENRVSWRLRINNLPSPVHTHIHLLYVWCACMCVCTTTSHEHSEPPLRWQDDDHCSFFAAFVSFVYSSSLFTPITHVDFICASCVSVVISSRGHQWALYLDGSGVALLVQRVTVTQPLFSYCCYLLVFVLIVGCRLYLMLASIPEKLPGKTHALCCMLYMIFFTSNTNSTAGVTWFSTEFRVKTLFPVKGPMSYSKSSGWKKQDHQERNKAHPGTLAHDKASS